MPVSTSVSGNELRAQISGEIDHHSAPALRESIDTAVTRFRPRVLCLDFSQVSFMDSSGIGLVMGRCRLMSALGGEVCVENLSESELRIMKMSGIGKIARIKEGENRVKA